MKTSNHKALVLMILLLSVALTPRVPAGPPLRVSEFGNLQTAIDIAEDGETIIVDVDTPGALVDKRLTIRGIPGRNGGGVITGVDLGGPYLLMTGLVLSSGASGSELINLKLDAEVGIASFAQIHAADDVTIRGCRIEASSFGLYLLNHYQQGNGGWVIEHNTIELRGSSQAFNVSVGILLSAHWNNTRVAHNKILGTKPNILSGIGVIASADVEIVQNEISVNVDHTGVVPSAEAVFLRGATIPGPTDPYVPVSSVTVSMNDFRGCRTTSGVFGVTYSGPLDADSDMTGLAAFDHFVTDGIPGTFSVGGNLGSGSPRRGEIHLSEIPVDQLLHPR